MKVFTLIGLVLFIAGCATLVTLKDKAYENCTVDTEANTMTCVYKGSIVTLPY